MAKQSNYFRSQIRLETGIHSLLKEYCEKNNLSLNEAMSGFIHDGLMDSMFNEDTQENKQHFIEIAKNRLETLSVREVREICSLIVHISQLKGY